MHSAEHLNSHMKYPIDHRGIVNSLFYTLTCLVDDF